MYGIVPPLRETQPRGEKSEKEGKVGRREEKRRERKPWKGLEFPVSDEALKIPIFPVYFPASSP